METDQSAQKRSKRPPSNRKSKSSKLSARGSKGGGKNGSKSTRGKGRRFRSAASRKSDATTDVDAAGVSSGTEGIAGGSRAEDEILSDSCKSTTPKAHPRSDSNVSLGTEVDVAVDDDAVTAMETPKVTEDITVPHDQLRIDTSAQVQSSSRSVSPSSRSSSRSKQRSRRKLLAVPSFRVGDALEAAMTNIVVDTDSPNSTEGTGSPHLEYDLEPLPPLCGKDKATFKQYLVLTHGVTDSTLGPADTPSVAFPQPLCPRSKSPFCQIIADTLPPSLLLLQNDHRYHSETSDSEFDDIAISTGMGNDLRNHTYVFSAIRALRDLREGLSTGAYLSTEQAVQLVEQLPVEIPETRVEAAVAVFARMINMADFVVRTGHAFRPCQASSPVVSYLITPCLTAASHLATSCSRLTPFQRLTPPGLAEYVELHPRR